MSRLVIDDRKTTVTQITTRYNQGMKNTISEHTTRRTLKQMDSSSRRPHQCHGHSLPEYCCWPCPSLYDYSVPIFWCYFQQNNAPSQSSNHLRLVSWTWQWVHFTQMASTVTRSQSNRAALGCGGTRDSHHGCADDKSAETVWCYHVNMDQNLWEMFPTPCWIHATKN